MTVRELAQALWLVGSLLDAREATYVWEGRFRFDLADGWYLILSSDFPGRLRLDACHRSGRGGSLWCLATDQARLRDLVLAAKYEALALTA